MKPTEKQIDYATDIAETMGCDLPEEFTMEAYSDFITEYADEARKIRNQILYSRGRTFQLQHSFVLNNGYVGDEGLNINPRTR